MEFIVAKDNTDSELHRLQKTLQYLPVFKDSDFRNMLLSAIVPFIYSYYNVVDVILSKVSARPTPLNKFKLLFRKNFPLILSLFTFKNYKR